jgi:hypothetical protein
MANIAEVTQNPQFKDVYQIGLDEDVLAGPDGVANRQAKELAERDQYLKATKVDKNGTDRLLTAAEGTKLGGIETGAQKNPEAATPSAIGLMSPEDKTKLDGIAAGATANAAGTVMPKQNGTGAVGSATGFSREDHVHPNTVATQAANDNSTKIANTAFVQTALAIYSYVGCTVEQYPDEPTPIEAGFLGTWEIWSNRAVLYGLSQDAPPSSVDYYSKVGSTIAAGATPVYSYHKSGDDTRLYRFIAQSANYTVPEELDPVKWTYIQPGVILERGKCANPLTSSDYTIGATIPSGSYQGFYITEVIVPGGKFFGIEGGFRPTFVSGGVQGDRQRAIYGRIAGNGLFWSSATASGALYLISGQNMRANFVENYDIPSVGIDSSRVNPTGPDVAPVHLSKRLWRRVS